MSETFQHSTVLAILIWPAPLGNLRGYVVHDPCSNLNVQTLNEFHRDLDPPEM